MPTISNDDDKKTVEVPEVTQVVKNPLPFEPNKPLDKRFDDSDVPKPSWRGKVANAFAVIALFLVALVGALVAATSCQNGNLRSEVSSMRTDLGDLKMADIAIKSDIIQLKTDGVKLNEKVDLMRKKLDGDIASLKRDLANKADQSEVNALKNGKADRKELNGLVTRSRLVLIEQKLDAHINIAAAETAPAPAEEEPPAPVGRGTFTVIDPPDEE